MAHVACPGAVEAVPANRPTCGRLRFKCKEHYHAIDRRVNKHAPLMLIRVWMVQQCMEGTLNFSVSKQSRNSPT
jgi:hypothetical protein